MISERPVSKQLSLASEILKEECVDIAKCASMIDGLHLETVFFLVENTLFNVPRYVLKDDQGVFADMFSMPQGETVQEGSSNSIPIILPTDITVFDFKNFLKAKRAQLVGESASLTGEEWLSVLKLSDLWELPGLRTKAINAVESHIHNLSTVDMILLAKKYCVSKWLMRGYVALAKRTDVITPDESVRLGVYTSCRLAEVRDKSWKYVCHYGRLSNSYYARDYRGCFDFVEEVRRVFRDELMEDEEYRAVHLKQSTCR